MLPTAHRARWQPLRCGLINIYRFDCEEFRFDNGRLLLRGNNGTGKSRVLALTLPFLLDGEVAPHRLEPDGDPARRIEWNLLMGRYPDRLGYTWIEFGRSTPEGDEYCTLGCGLQAVEGRGLASRWYFIARGMRIGQDLFLLTPQRTPLMRDRLVEALGSNGQVFTVAKEYRTAVNSALFRLDEARYQGLLDLLIALRQPQLSRRLDEAVLSRTLSQALPRIPERVITDVAESFRGLEEDRVAVQQLEAVAASLGRFQGRYLKYLQIGCRREASRLRDAQNAYEMTQRRWRDLQAQLTQLGQGLEELSTTRAQVQRDLGEADVTVQTLQESPQMQDARALDHARQVVADRAEDVERQARQVESVSREVGARRRQFDTACERADRQGVAARTALERIERAAKAVEVGPPTTDAQSQHRFAERLDQMKRGIRRLREQNELVRRAEAAWAEAQRAQRSLQSQVDEAREHSRSLQDALHERTDERMAAVRRWLGTLQELAVADPLDAVQAWCLDADETQADPLQQAVDEAWRLTHERLTALVVQLGEALRAEESALRELRAEREEVLSGRYEPPPSPPGRDAAGRVGRPGAPFYRLVDFQDHLSDTERAGLEAALEASGLLDAWVCADGTVLSPETFDAVLSADGGEVQRPVGSVLRVSRDPDDGLAAQVGDATVAAVLARIGLSAGGDAWVDVDGRWQLGPLQGRWMKSAACHIGQGAREAARRARLLTLETLITESEARLSALESEREAARTRQEAARAEAAGVPSSQAVRQVWADLRAASRQIRDLQAKVAEAELRAFKLQQAAVELREARDDDARDLGLADWVERLEELQERVHECQEALVRWVSALDSQAEAEDQRATAGEALVRIERQAAEEGERLDEARRVLHEARTRRDTLESTVGAAVEQIVRQLAAARERAEGLRREALGLEKKAFDLHGQLSRREGDVQSAQEAHDAATVTRDAAVGALAALATVRVLTDVVPSVDTGDPAHWTPTRAEEIGRAILAATADVPSDDAALRKRGGEVFSDLEELRSALLPRDYRPQTDMEQGLVVVTIRYQNRTLTPAELSAEMGREVAVRQGMLTSREREIIENHLIGEIAQHLHDLLHRAEAWVGTMNDELERRPMSTGMKLRFRWEPLEDGPAGLLEARRRLMRMSATWSPAERQALGEFLQSQIHEARRDEELTWQQNLHRALDYRNWHRFTVERYQDGQWRALNRRTHGTGSGGEKAIALTIPQFAAAAAYYHSADAAAPRLILLDEVFVGVDQDMRGKCMALLEQFDLDFMMTSEREWGCYADLKGLAIAQLAARPGIDAVYVSRWVWTGHEMLELAYVPPPIHAEQATLFG